MKQKPTTSRSHNHVCTPEPHHCSGECHDRVENCPECSSENQNSGCHDGCECSGGCCSDGVCGNCEQLATQLTQAQDRERRALADYQNLLRRTQKDTAQFAKLATKDLINQLIQPLEHLRLASQQVQDKGLDMVITQLWQVLEQNGVTTIDPAGEEFSVETMEAVERTGKSTKVSKVLARGYLLNGEVLQYAKVVVGGQEK